MTQLNLILAKAQSQLSLSMLRKTWIYTNVIKIEIDVMQTNLWSCANNNLYGGEATNTSMFVKSLILWSEILTNSQWF
jgi:hypothetical protein